MAAPYRESDTGRGMCEPVSPEQAREARELTCSSGSERAAWRLTSPEKPPSSLSPRGAGLRSPGQSSRSSRSSRSRPGRNGLRSRINDEVLRLTLRLDFLLEVMTMNGDKVSVSLTTCSIQKLLSWAPSVRLFIITFQLITGSSQD